MPPSLTNPTGGDHYAVVGNPIAHSRSPAIHQRFAELTGTAIHYSHCLAPLDGFTATVRDLQARCLKGCNVTVPFKLQAAELADAADAGVRLAQAANTLVLQTDGRITAYNTDGIGLVRDICSNAQVPLAGARVLLLGAGGAAAGVLAPLLQQAPAALTVCNRSVERAEALVKSHAELASAHGVQLRALALDALPSSGLAAADLLINATASSLQGAALPIANPAALLAPGALVYDMMYGPAAQTFLHWASGGRDDVLMRDGLGMLVEQAAESFWLGAMCARLQRRSWRSCALRCHLNQAALQRPESNW